MILQLLQNHLLLTLVYKFVSSVADTVREESWDELKDS